MVKDERRRRKGRKEAMVSFVQKALFSMNLDPSSLRETRDADETDLVST